MRSAGAVASADVVTTAGAVAPGAGSTADPVAPADAGSTANTLSASAASVSFLPATIMSISSGIASAAPRLPSATAARP